MSQASSPKAAVIGAGTMGHGIAQVFAAAGWPVSITDTNAQALAGVADRVKSNLAAPLELGLIDRDRAERALELIEPTPDLARAVDGAEIVIESIVEVLQPKQEMFAQLEELASPQAILATNTSAIAIGSIAEKLQAPQRVVGTHFWNPPHVLPCVEVIKSRFTDQAVFDRAVEIMAAVGKEPVRVLKDVPGFLGNRMQHALQREAMSLLDSGVAEAEDIDRVVRYSFGLRLALMGPLERADLGGLDITRRVQEYLLPFLDSRTEASSGLKKLVDQGAVGAKAGQGFYDWPPEKLAHKVARRDKLLLQLIELARDKD